MNLKAAIYESLQEHLSYPQEVSVEDIINQSCGYRHARQLEGATPIRAENPQTILLREIQRRVVGLVSKYFAGAYPEEYRGGYCVMDGAVTVDIAGFVGDTLLDVAVVSTTAYNEDKAPRRVLLAAATRAALVGAKHVILTVVDRDKQAWTFWEMEGDFAKAAADTLHDAAYVTALAKGDRRPLGLASKHDCKACPWKHTCQLEPAEPEVMVYDMSGIQVRKSLRVRTDIQKYLWSLNDVPNGRMKKVIHPSEISTTPCDRLIAYGLLGEDEKESVDPKLRRIFDFGHIYHDVLQAAMAWNIPDFEAEVLVHHAQLSIAGHCDGVTGKRCQEIKSMGSNGFAKLSNPKSDHKKQATTYAVVLELSVIDFIYINKETAELAVYSIPPDKGMWHKTALRASNIKKTVAAGDLPPQIDSEYVCSRCKYAWKCRPAILKVAGRGSRSFSR